MRIVIPVLSLLVVGASWPSQSLATDRMSPAAIEADVRRVGAKAVVNRLWESHAWGSVEAHVSSGDRAWIALAPTLSAGTDAATSEGLGLALAEALPKWPKAVLAVLDLTDRPVLGPSQVCSVPFYDVSAAFLRHYKQRALAAVSAVRDQRLAPAKRACLAKLRGS